VKERPTKATSTETKKVGRRWVAVSPPRSANADFINDAHLMARTGSTGDYHYGTLNITYDMLEQMANVPQIAGIHQTRTNQATDWARPQENPVDIGWRIRMEKRQALPLRKDRVDIQKAAEVISRAGAEWLPGGFEQFLRVIVPDTLTYDQANFEIIREKDGTPYAFIPVDPKTIRRAIPTQEIYGGEPAPRYGRWDFSEGFVQVMVSGEIVNYYEPGNMAWGIRRPRSSIKFSGYGHPELEQLASIITGLVNAQTFNQVNFTTGIHAHTALVLKSAWDQNRFNEFRREIQTSMAGGRNFKRIPIIQLSNQLQEELEAVTLGKSNAEMEFAEWINWLLKVACSLYAIDPSEMGYVFGAEGSKSNFISASPMDKILQSKERGLRPLLRAIQSWIDYYVIKPTWPHLKFEFAGFDASNEREKHDMDMAAVTTYRTPNELRAERGLEPLATPIADLPLNAFFSQAAQKILDNDVPPPQFDIDNVGAFVDGRRLPPLTKPA